jgi:hypothetical protein
MDVSSVGLQLAQTSASSQNQAIDFQIQSRIDFEVSKLLPRLHGLANLFSDISSLDLHSTNLVKFNEVLHTLTRALHHLQNSSVQVQHSAVPKSNVAPISSMKAAPATKRNCHVLLPPSPEHRQCRKDSHAPF